MNSVLFKNYSVTELQRLNNAIYKEVNGRDFELTEMVSRLSRFTSRTLLRVRKNETERTGYHLCMMLSWLFAVANRLYPLNMHQELATHCALTLPAETPLAEIQAEFSSRHPDVTLSYASICLAEKVLGIASELEYYRATHEHAHFLNMVRRMAQSIEAICVVASLLRISLHTEHLLTFPDGKCPSCRKAPCKCGYRADKVV